MAPRHTTPHSEETKKKISESRKGLGKQKKSTETKERMSIAALGKPKSKEACKKMSVAKKGKPWTQARWDAQMRRKK
jgi:ssDNA-binding Zn-finger/Zn-ribbon topoisomerase 1